MKRLFIYTLLFMMFSGILNAQDMRALFDALANKYNVPITDDDKEKLASIKWKTKGVKLHTTQIDDNDPTTKDVQLENELEMSFTDTSLTLTEYIKREGKKKPKKFETTLPYLEKNYYAIVNDTVEKRVLGMKTKSINNMESYLWKDVNGNYGILGVYDTFSESGGDGPLHTEVRLKGRYFYRLNE